MDPYLESEIRKRRDDSLKSARRAPIRRGASARTTGVRARIADGAQAISDALAALARSLRDGAETA